MYQTIKSVIGTGRYELNDMLHKIDTLWAQGDLTDDQRSELVQLAQSNADPAQSYAPLQEQINQALDRVTALEATAADLIRRVTALETGEEPEPEPEPEEWPEWYQWDGVGRVPWQNGSKCTHNGVRYISRVDNNVWEPGAAGVYENIWEAVE